MGLPSPSRPGIPFLLCRRTYGCCLTLWHTPPPRQLQPCLLGLGNHSVGNNCGTYWLGWEYTLWYSIPHPPVLLERLLVEVLLMYEGYPRVYGLCTGVYVQWVYSGCTVGVQWVYSGYTGCIPTIQWVYTLPGGSWGAQTPYLASTGDRPPGRGSSRGIGSAPLFTACRSQIWGSWDPQILRHRE